MKDIVRRKTTRRGLKNWTCNCIRFYYQRTLGNILHKRDQHLWLFSAWEGMKYSDNSKYLYEYISSNEPDITCYWITKSKELYEMMSSQGYKVSLVGTAENAKLEQNAGVAIYTHGIDDFGDFPNLFGARLICLWHGAPVVKYNYMTRTIHDSKFLDALSKIKTRIFTYIYRDITFATSDYCKENFRRESLTINEVAVIGQPRNDALAMELSVGEVLSSEFITKYSLNDDFRYITYMPTYRGTISGQRFLESLIITIINDDGINEFLSSKKIKLLMKMHYLTDITGMKFNDNIIFLDDRDVACPQKLLSLSKLLITDYSSCTIDFALKGNEILFFTPDLETYDRENGLYTEYKEIIRPYRINSVSELREKLIESEAFNFKSQGIISELNRLYNKQINEVGNYCKLVTEHIKTEFCRDTERNV